MSHKQEMHVFMIITKWLASSLFFLILVTFHISEIVAHLQLHFSEVTKRLKENRSTQT